MANKPVSIWQLNNYIGKLISSDAVLNEVSVIGEVSNLNYHSTGHVYFTLKDEKSKINCFLASSNSERIKYIMENGMEIVATGFVNVFQKGGYYSLNVVDLKPSGEGDLTAAFNKLKEKMESEGLFSIDHKKPIPTFPKNIMIITSPTGAAVRDIQKIIMQKNDYVNIYILPAIVQGENAADDIAKAIVQANKEYPEMDTIILGRGGGSLEELWAFNEEVVLRAIFNSTIPIISAVGHETDITLSDLVADLRAETPTAAASLAVPDIREIRSNLNYFKEISKNYVERKINNKYTIIKTFNMDSLSKNISQEIIIRDKQIKNLLEGMYRDLKHKLEIAESGLVEKKIALDILNPRAYFDKGYSMVLNSDNRNVNSIKQIKEHDELKIILKDGRIKVKAVEVEEQRD